jgi:hypothetical protein
MSGAIAMAGFAGLLLVAGTQAPIASFDDLGRAVAACIRSDEPVAGSEVELRFTLTQRGTILGKPTIVMARAVTSMAAQRALVTTVFEALRRCTPFPLAPAFAQAVAGRPVTLRVRTGGQAVTV